MVMHLILVVAQYTKDVRLQCGGLMMHIDIETSLNYNNNNDASLDLTNSYSIDYEMTTALCVG